MANLTPVSGILDVTDKGYGFLRSIEKSYAIDSGDIYVGQGMIKKFRLQKGMEIEGEGVRKNNKQGNIALEKIKTIDSLLPEDSLRRTFFNKLTVIDPEEKLTVETGKEPLTTRIIDLFAPIGKGQRALMVSPPKAGKTTFLEHIAHGIKENNPDVNVIIFLIDERPEEVTHFRRTVGGEVVATNFDTALSEQIRVSELVMARVMRSVEGGKDVVLIVDSLTRLGRAYNKAADGSGKTMSGGVATGALDFPRKFFGAARNIEKGGSLTIVATCLIDTGSRMDEVIFQEFKGTGNMELVLERSLAEERIYPAVNISKSGTRKEEKLQDPDDLRKIWTLHRALGGDRTFSKYKALIAKMAEFEDNKGFLKTVPAT